MTTVVIVGAGTMGSGIALACAQSKYQVILHDSYPGVITKARQNIESNLQFLVDKKKISEDDKNEVISRITFSEKIDECVGDIIIEAVIENIEIKNELFRKLESINRPDALLVSNTSSLSVNEMQKSIMHPGRFAGLHFFNPAHIMKLVEVVNGDMTSAETIKSLTDFCDSIGKKPVVCKDAPGFIVNRVARHFYLESMRLAQQDACSISDIDEILETSGFKMGPFRLMDMIGMDVNLAVSESLFNAFNEERFRPSELQVEKVKRGELGRKTKKGFYSYE